MEGRPFCHRSVLPEEVLGHLSPRPGAVMVDGTLGGGGHAEALLGSGARVVALDRDEVVIAEARRRWAERVESGRLDLVCANFSLLTDVLSGLGIGRVDGILLDLGVSSMQLDWPERGFSFREDGPLDMRMSCGAGGITAADIVNEWPQEDLARIFREYGEERHAWRLARWIVEARRDKPFRRTLQLAEAVERLLPRRGRIHPATRVFQALRIAVNDELGHLERVLAVAPSLLAPGGRIVVISFHSLEDRIVKEDFRKRSTEWLDAPNWPSPRRNPDFCYVLPARKPIVPGDEECARNPRARSAKLRMAERMPYV